MTPRLLQRVARFSRRHYRAVFVAFGVLAAVSLFLASRLKFDTDVLNLLPRNDPVVRTYLETLEEFGTIDYLLLVVRVPEGEVLAPYQTFVDKLGARLDALPEIETVDYRIGEMSELLRSFFPKAVLFLDEAGRRELARKVSDAGILERVEEMRRLLSTPQGIAAKQLLTLDPFGLSDIFLDRLASSRGSLKVDWTSGYYLSRDHRLMVMLVQPVRPPQDIDFDEKLVAKINREVAATRAEWPKILGVENGEPPGELLDEDLPPPPVVEQGGSYLTALDDASFIRRDMIINILTSSIGVFGLFLLAFRRLGPLVYALVPLACGLILTFGFSALTLGRLSSATSGTAALLIGLGIDFVIVSYGRYVEERRRGEDLDAALLAMSSSSGRAVVVGAVTTAATFYAFLVTGFRGLWEMGFLTGTGILFCMVSVLLLLPAMLAWHEEHHRKRDTQPNFYLHSFGTDRLIRFALRRPWQVLAVGVVLTAVAGFYATHLEFEESMKTMRPKGNRGIRVAEEVAEEFGSGFNYMMLVASGDSPEQVLELADKGAEGAKKLVDEGILYGFDAPTALIPPPRRQAAVLDWLARERGNGLALDRIVSTFRRDLASEGMRYAPFKTGVELFSKAISPTEPLGVGDFEESRDTRRLLERYVQHTDHGWKSIVYLYPPENHWRREAPPQALALADALGPHVVLTGSNRVNAEMRVRVKRDAWIAGILGFVLVGLLLLADFRRLRDTVLALTPLLIGILWMLGAMGILDIPLTFMNIFVATMIIGIGVDYGLHILHRYREIERADPQDFERGLLETGKAILVAALSTICGFGSLSLSHYPGLRSTGYVAVLGALATALVAITLLPATFSLRKRAKDGRWKEGS